MADLREKRDIWEKDLSPNLYFNDGCVCLVLLRDVNGHFHCHRYFTVSINWEVSVDHQGVLANKAMEWLIQYVPTLDIMELNPLND